MLTRILHEIVAHPRIYDWVQALAGAELLRRHIPPPVLLSANLDEGDSSNAPHLRYLRERIRGL